MLVLVFLLAIALTLGGCSNPVDSLLELRTEQEARQTGSDSSYEKAEQGGREEKQQKDYNDRFLKEGTRYAYSTLTDAQKIWYRDVEHVLGSMETDGDLSGEGVKLGLREQDLEHVFLCVCMDHPEFFYVDGFSYVTHVLDDQVIGYTFSGNYGMTVEEAIQKEAEIQRACDEILAPLRERPEAYGTDYDKIKYVYETLIRQTEYDVNAPENQSIYSALVGKRSVCQGYSKSMQYLLNLLGVECALVQGTAMGQPHGWNLVRSGGDYYYVDVTWGDNSYHPSESGQGASDSPEILYEYLCVTTEEILKEHQIDEIVPLPECTGTKDNYFVREGAFFTSADEAGLKRLFHNASEENGWQVSLKCAGYGTFQEILDLLLEQNKIFDYYPAGGTRVSYYQNEELLCLTFWVTN